MKGTRRFGVSELPYQRSATSRGRPGSGSQRSASPAPSSRARMPSRRDLIRPARPPRKADSSAALTRITSASPGRRPGASSRSAPINASAWYSGALSATCRPASPGATSPRQRTQGAIETVRDKAFSVEGDAPVLPHAGYFPATGPRVAPWPTQRPLPARVRAPPPGPH